MTLFLILSLMTAVAIFAILWPLSRRPLVAAEGHDVAVYRDQLAEVDRDREAGLLPAEEAEAARLEISRRLLAAADARTDQAPDAGGSLWRRRAVALVALIGLPAIATGLYLHWGSPTIPSAPLAARLDLPPEQRSVEGMVAQVEAHLERNPNDGRGWEVIAPVYMRMDRFNDAVRARGNALRLLGPTADREADLGEALVAAGNSIVTADAKSAFERALKIDPDHLKAQYFIGLSAEQDGRPEEAARIWREMLERSPADAPFRPLVVQSLARVDKGEAPKGLAEPVRPQPGPNAEDMAAAQQLTPEQRTQMVRGMVDRLAERLKTDGHDFDGWLRLVRAYVVIGEADKAQAALASARSAAGSDDGKRKRLDDLAKTLGLDG